MRLATSSCAAPGGGTLGHRIAGALLAACDAPGSRSLVGAGTAVMALIGEAGMRLSATVGRVGPLVEPLRTDVDALIARLFEEEGHRLVRLARLFVDDRNAAEDLVQEGFVRLARSVHRINDEAKAAAYLRSIVLNLARDHNRRGLVSLRHHLPFDDARASAEDEIVLRDDQRAIIDALRDLPVRQRDCLVLRYYEELGVDDIATTLGISRNSVKTHLKRGLAAMEARLGTSTATAQDAPS